MTTSKLAPQPPYTPCQSVSCPIKEKLESRTEMSKALTKVASSKAALIFCSSVGSSRAAMESEGRR